MPFVFVVGGNQDNVAVLPAAVGIELVLLGLGEVPPPLLDELLLELAETLAVAGLAAATCVDTDVVGEPDDWTGASEVPELQPASSTSETASPPTSTSDPTDFK